MRYAHTPLAIVSALIMVGAAQADIQIQFPDRMIVSYADMDADGEEPIYWGGEDYYYDVGPWMSELGETNTLGPFTAGNRATQDSYIGSDGLSGTGSAHVDGSGTGVGHYYVSAESHYICEFTVSETTSATISGLVSVDIMVTSYGWGECQMCLLEDWDPLAGINLSDPGEVAIDETFILEPGRTYILEFHAMTYVEGGDGGPNPDPDQEVNASFDFVLTAEGGNIVVLDLADVVAGGDGTGTGGDQGVDQSTGFVVYDQTAWIDMVDDFEDYFAVPDLPYIDGVFTPDGGAGPNQINSNGDTADVLTDTTRSSWDYLWPGPNLGGSSVLDDVDYMEPGHSMIGFHVNKGITFDLNAIELDHAAMQATRFTAMAGLDDVAGPGGSVELFVYIDDQLVLQETGIEPEEPAIEIDIAIPTEASFLTIIATDAGDMIDNDDFMLGDPRLTLEGAGIEGPDAAFVCIDVGANPDTIVAFNTNAPADADASEPVAVTAGNFVRGIAMQTEDRGWYVTSSDYVGGEVGIWRMYNGVSSKIGDLPFDTWAGGGLDFATGLGHLWYVIDPDLGPGDLPDDPPIDGPIDETLYRIDYDGTFTTQAPLWMDGVDTLAIFGIAQDHDDDVLFGYEEQLDALITIDTTTGECNIVGAGLGFDVQGYGDLAFTLDGQYLILTANQGEMYLVDKMSGESLGSFGTLPFFTSAIAPVGMGEPCSGDVDGDGFRDLSDLGALLASFGMSTGDPLYNPDADFDNDGDVDLGDLGELLAVFDIPCP
jgi:hypothetical protein